MALFAKKQVKNEKTALPRSVRKQVTAYTAASVVLLVLAVVMILIRGTVSSKVADRKQEEAWYRESLESVEQIKSEVSRTEDLIKRNGANIASPLMEASDFYAYVASAAEKFSLKIGYVRAGEETYDNGVRLQRYLMLFTGAASDLKLMLDSLETLPSSYSIESLSYRVNTNSEWVRRAIDSETTYEWFDSASEGASAEERTRTSLSDMLDYSEYTLYLTLALVSTY